MATRTAVTPSRAADVAADLHELDRVRVDPGAERRPTALRLVRKGLPRGVWRSPYGPYSEMSQR